MSDYVTRALGNALAPRHGRKAGPQKGDTCWIVVGRNHRNEQVHTGTGLGAYQTRASAQEFADELNDLGGAVCVRKAVRTS